MGKKKAFIDKTKSVTFRLIPAVDTTPKPIGNPELVNVVPVTDQELEEREKYGIYYADNYNYMSHLKEKNELPIFHLSDKSTLAVPQSAVKLATHIIEVKGKEIPIDATKKIRLPSVSASVIDIEDEIDPEILEMLNEGEEGFGEEGEIEDDFLNLAGGVEMPEGRRIFEEFRKTAHDMSDSEIEDEDMDDVIEEEMDEGELDDGKPHLILKQPPANADKAEFDARFNQFYENMEGSDFEDEDAEFSDEDPEVDEALLENIAEGYQEEKNKAFAEKPDELSKELSLKAHKTQELEKNEETEKIEMDVRSKRAKWDCESITTTYSNIYNHPTIIREAPKRKPKLRKILDNDDDQMDCDTESVKTTRSVVSTVRMRGETTEDRKERKKAVKEERRERRIEKKSLKASLPSLSLLRLCVRRILSKNGVH